MGQATVDLPDPLNPPTAAPDLSAADDLLSQLAGDEIDRLLAESDGESAPAPPSMEAAPELVAPTTAEPAKVDPPAALSNEIDELFAELQAAPVSAPKQAPAEPPTAASPLEPPIAAPTAASEPASPPVPEMEQVAAAAVVEPDERAIDELEPAIAADERAALERAALDDISLAIDPMAQLQGMERDLPIVLKPLAWLSAPLDRFPDEVRETLGKIAILTIVNALAVFAYVMMFRHGH
jgi:hypothetical protein